VTLNLAETSVAKSQPSVLHGLIFLFSFEPWSQMSYQRSVQLMWMLVH